MSVEQLEGSLRRVLIQYERAMHELGWTMVDIRSREALDALVAQAGEADTLRQERDEWEERYEKLLSEVGGVWPG